MLVYQRVTTQPWRPRSENLVLQRTKSTPTSRLQVARLSNFAARRRGCLRLHQEAEEEDLDLEPFSFDSQGGAQPMMPMPCLAQPRFFRPVLHPCNGSDLDPLRILRPCFAQAASLGCEVMSKFKTQETTGVACFC